MILETYKVFENKRVVPYAYYRHTVNTIGLIYIKYSLRQKLLNLLGLSDYSPVYIDRKIEQIICYDSCYITTLEQEKINQEKSIQKRRCEELLWSRNYKEWPEIESKIKKYIINEGCSLKESYVRGYGKKGS